MRAGGGVGGLETITSQYASKFCVRPIYVSQFLSKNSTQSSKYVLLVFSVCKSLHHVLFIQDYRLHLVQSRFTNL
jgi:hypothetical protein